MLPVQARVYILNAAEHYQGTKIDILRARITVTYFVIMNTR